MAQKPRENPLSNSQTINSQYILMMMVHEENDHIYTSLIGQTVVEIVIVINTLMKTQSSKNILLSNMVTCLA